MPYRWVILAVGVAGQAAYSAILFGVPVLAPKIQDHYDVGLAQIGILLAACSIGTVATLIPWGLLTHRLGERLTMGIGLLGGGTFALAALLPSFWVLVGIVALAGASGASVNGASGRAVMGWFAPGERGLAMGIRHTSVPIGGAFTALAIPAIHDALGLRAALSTIGGLTLACAAAAFVWLREPPALEEEEVERLTGPLRDRRLWLLSLGSVFYVAVQISIIGFLVLYLHEQRGLSLGAAGAATACVHVLGGAGRIGFGALSDRMASRMPLLRHIGLAMAAATGTAAVVLSAPNAVVVPLLVLAGGIAMCWNGLSFTVAAELAGRRGAGAAIGFQQTAVAIGTAASPVAFAFAVDSASWRVAFAGLAVLPLIGWRVLARVA
jgi:sugar phosphate permease